MIDGPTFLENLFKAINEDKITLPTLPEVALKVQAAIEDEDATVKDIAEIIATDAALSARLLQVVNSPMYRGHQTIDSIQMAVSRLGGQLVRSLVISLAMRQMFQPTSEFLDHHMRILWQQSVSIGAISQVLSHNAPHLLADQALLAGLIHNIGALPLLVMAEDMPELLNDEEELTHLITGISPMISEHILKKWEFPDYLAEVPAHCWDPAYDSGPDANYADLVLVARLQAFPETFACDIDHSNIPAFGKLGLEPDIQIVEIEGVAEEIQEIEEILIS